MAAIQGDWYIGHSDSESYPVKDQMRCVFADQANGDRFMVAKVWSDGFDYESTARLIASAPEMLAMLKDLREEYQPCNQCLCDRDDPADDWECDGCRLVRVIFKAEGIELLRCCFCNKTIRPSGYYVGGDNAQPVADGRCCGSCNRKVVLPARMAEVEGRRYAP